MTHRIVMAGLVPAIHVLLLARKTWMPATGAGMTVQEAMPVIAHLQQDLQAGWRSMHYVAVIEKEPDSAFGIWFPDIEGCFSAGETVEEAVANAAAALRQHVEAVESAGRHVPAARSTDVVLCDEDIAAAIEAGAVLTVIHANSPCTNQRGALVSRS
jgi:predicted RNase H-like HicB family nuclease